MFVHFLVDIPGSHGVTIVKVGVDHVTVCGLVDAKEKAKEVVLKMIGLSKDFEIKDLTLAGLISKLGFVDGICELSPLTGCEQ